MINHRVRGMIELAAAAVRYCITTCLRFAEILKRKRKREEK